MRILADENFPVLSVQELEKLEGDFGDIHQASLCELWATLCELRPNRWGYAFSLGLRPSGFRLRLRLRPDMSLYKFIENL